MKPGHRFVLAQRVAFGAVAALGFVAMGVGGGLGPTGALAATLAVSASLWPGRPRLPERTWVLVQLAFLLWLAVRWLQGSHILSLFGALLLFVQVHRLLTRRRTRDDLYSAFIAFGQVLLASVLTVDPSFFLVFMAFVFCTIQALLLSRMALAAEAEWVASGRPSDAPPPAAAYQRLDPFIRARTVAATTALAAFVQVGTVLLFFLLPRAQAAMLSGLVDPMHVTGFSDKVRLGSVGTMQLSREPVMRVHVEDTEGRSVVGVERLLWRGVALDRFDGRSWELSDTRRTSLVPRGGRQGHPPPREQPWSVKAEVTLEALDAGVLFHLARPAGIYGDFAQLEVSETDGYHVPGPPRRHTYSIYALPDPPPPDRLRRQDPREAPPTLLRLYTQLPPKLSPTFARLADQWAGGGGSALDEALLVQRQLQGFTYSLDQAPSAYEDPLLAFVDDVQEGHCEYFASAMAVLLRTRGIPTRVVNGFAGAEWNPVGEYWVVRQLHAHSWVEVWFPDDGWVAFDPTPSSGAGVAGRAQLSWLGRVQAWADYGGVVWSEVMLDYGLDTQITGIKRGLDAFARLSRGDLSLRDLMPGRPSPVQEAPGEESPSVLPAALLGLALLVLAVLATRLLQRRGGRGAQRDAERLAELLGARLARPDEPAPTLRALAQRAEARDPERFEGAQGVVAAYNEARFGGGELPADVASSLGRLVRRARRWRPRP